MNRVKSHIAGDVLNMSKDPEIHRTLRGDEVLIFRVTTKGQKNG
jgi:hypothetical protein